MAAPAKAGVTRPAPFWSVPADELLARLEATPAGLSRAQADERFARFGANALKPRKRLSALPLLLAQFKSPLVLILVAASVPAFFLHDRTNAGIILGIVAVSAVLGSWQEYAAAGRRRQAARGRAGQGAGAARRK